MGFGVSGSVVIVLFGLFIALGTFHVSGINTLERLSGAEAEQADHLRHVQESALNISSVTLTDSTNCDVEIAVNNTGSTALALNVTDLLLDNTVETDWEDGATVDGDVDTWLWFPGEQLVVTRAGLSAAPDSVSVITKTGITSRRQTEGLVC